MAKVQLEAFGVPFNSEEAKLKFRNQIYNCPFDTRRLDVCDKPNNNANKYGNCSVRTGDQQRIICPRRFYENDYRVIKDIKEFVWGNNEAIDCYAEFRLEKQVENDRFHYGNLDWLLVNQNDPTDFCAIEVQTDCTTGTGGIAQGINDLLSNNLRSNYNFGLNTLASFKGFLPQFIFKGQLFDDWKKPYIAVMQDELWAKFISKFRIRFGEITEYSTETFVFFIYSLKYDEARNVYFLGDLKMYSSRWIDLLLSFSVESQLLIGYNLMCEKIAQRKSTTNPVLTIDQTP